MAWHTWSSKIDLVFTATGAQITYQDSFESHTSLGRLSWALTHQARGVAELRCTDRAGRTVCSVSMQDKLRSGRLEVWSPGLSAEQVDEVVVSALAEVEDWRRKVENKEAQPGIMGGIVAASLNN